MLLSVKNPRITSSTVVAPRVLLLTDSAAFAGTERHMLDLARGLAASGSDVWLGAPDGAPLLEKSFQYGIHCLGANPKYFLPAMLYKVTQLLRQREIDLIHAHNGVSHILAAAALQAAGRGTLIATHHFVSPKRSQRRGGSRWISHHAHQWACGKTSSFIAISNAVASSCRDLCHGVDMKVIHSGMFPPEGVSKQGKDVRAEFQIPDSAPLIVCVARLEKEKSIETLVRAMRPTVDNFPAAHCLIVGDGTQRQVLSNLVHELGLERSVHLAGFNPDPSSVIAAGDLFVLPTPHEGFGLVILEAMFLAKPVIVAGSGGQIELIQDRVNGRLFTALDSAALATIIKELLDDRQYASVLAEAARNTAWQRFHAMRMVDEVMALYNDALFTQGGVS